MVKFFTRLLQSMAARRQQRTPQLLRGQQSLRLASAAEVCCLPSSKASLGRRAQATRLQSFDRLETRTLLTATLNGLADGRVIYSGTNVANNLTVNFDGTNYSFNDTGENIQLLGTVAGGTGNLTNTVTFNPATLGAFTTLIINNGVGNDTVTISGFRGGQEGLDVQDAAAQGTDTLNINADLGSAGSRLQRPAQLLSETVNLAGSVFTNNATINLGATAAAVNLLSNVTVNAGTGTVGSTSTINGANSLTIQGGSVQLTGAVGGVTPLTDISLTATGAGAMQVPAMTATGDISITAGVGGTNLRGNLTAGDDITITSASTSVTVGPVTLTTGGAAGNDINVTGLVSGTQAFGLNAGVGGNIVVGGNISLTGTGFLVAGGNSIDFNGSTSANSGINLGTVTGAFVRSLTAGAGDVSVNGNVTFDGVGAVTNTAGTANSFLFTGNVTGNGSDFNLRGAQNATIQGTVSGVALLSLDKGGGGTMLNATLNNATAQTISVIASTIHPQGDLTASVQGIALTGNVVLDGAADPTITLTSGLGAGDSITITGTVEDSGAATALELIAGDDTTAATDGAVTVTGAIGGVTPIQSLRANGSVVNLQAVNVATGNILLGGGEIILNGNLGGSGGNNSVIFAPNGTGGTLEVYNAPTSPSSSNMTIDNTDLTRVTASIENMVFGSNTTGTVNFVPDANPSLVTGNFVLNRNVEFRGNTVNLNESIDQNTFTVNCFANTLNVNLPMVDVGDVTFTKLTPGGTFVVNGNFGQTGWGANNLTVNNVTGDVTMTGHFGGVSVASITVNCITLDTTAQTSAVEANGDVTLNVTTLRENGGVFSTTGSVLIGGNVVSTAGPLTFLVPTGENLLINGTVTAAGNVTIRGRGGAIGNATITGNVTTTGSFAIDSSGAQTATLVNLAGVNATSVLVRGVDINLGGNLTGTAGSVHLLGNVTLNGDVVMTSSGLASHFVRVDGNVNGAFNLEAQSGLGQTHFVGKLGNLVALNNLKVRNGGFNYIYDNINVTGTVDYLVGDTANGGQDQLLVLSGKTITAGTSITLEADTVTVNQGTQLFAPVKSVISNGGT